MRRLQSGLKTVLSVTHAVDLEQFDSVQGIFLPNWSQLGVEHRDDGVVARDSESICPEAALLAQVWHH